MPESVAVGKRVSRCDSIPLDSKQWTPEGYLISTPIVTSTGIFEYHEPDGSVRRELRLPEHIFNEKSLASYEAKPVILTHDAERVDKDNVADEIIGTMLSKGFRDGDDVRVKVVIHDTDEAKQSGLRELSLGYDLETIDEPGEWEGQPYDCIQTDIVVNHLALVREARAGDQARLNLDSKDKKKGDKRMPKNLKQVVDAYRERRARRLDEQEVEEDKDVGEEFPPKTDDGENPFDDEDDGDEDVAEQGGDKSDLSIEERIQNVKDRRDRRDAEGEPEDKDAAMGLAAQYDEDVNDLIEIAEELQATVDLLKAEASAAPEPVDEEDEDDTIELGGEEVGSGGGASIEIGGDGENQSVTIRMDAVDSMFRERLKLVRIGDKLNIEGIEDMKPTAAKTAIIKKVLPDMRLDGKGKAYINTAFEFAVDRMKNRKDTDYQRRQTVKRADSKSLPVHGKTNAQSARARMIEKLTNGGKE